MVIYKYVFGRCGNFRGRKTRVFLTYCSQGIGLERSHYAHVLEEKNICKFTASYYVCWCRLGRQHGSRTMAGGEPLECSVALNVMGELG
jgi:hypothetical protein